jgi:hypothetical protein
VTLDTADGLTAGFTTSGAATTITDKAANIIFDNVPAGAFHATATPTVLGKPSSTVSGVRSRGGDHDGLCRPHPASPSPSLDREERRESGRLGAERAGGAGSSCLPVGSPPPASTEPA